MAKCDAKIGIRFVLTRDMVPIHYRGKEGQYSAMFTCPLPLGYMDILKKIPRETIEKTVVAIINDINTKASRLEEPFENLLLGYEHRPDKEELLKTMKIKDWSFDDRGLYVVAIHGAEGDAYISTEGSLKCDSCVYDLAEAYFDHNYAFYCHNMDYYWQALMVREVLIKYFNFLAGC